MNREELLKTAKELAEKLGAEVALKVAAATLKEDQEHGGLHDENKNL